MASFKVADRSFTIRLNLGLASRIHAATKIDLPKLLQSGEALASLFFANACTLAEAVWMAIEREAIAAGVSREQFEEGFGPDEPEAAQRALLEAAIDLMPTSQGRERIRAKIPAMLRELEKTVNDHVSKSLDELLA